MNKQLVFFIILILLLSIIFMNKRTKFTEFVRMEYDLYIPSKDNVIDFKNKSINSNRICIYDDTDPNNVDLECISAQQLFSVIDMPQQRKNEICIDDKCITKEDIQIMNGTKNFKIKSKDYSTLGYNDTCLKTGTTQSNLCGQRTITIHTLDKVFCDNASHPPINFVLQKGANRDVNLKRNDIESTSDRMPNNADETRHHG